MPELILTLSDQDHAAVLEASAEEGLSTQAWAARAIHRGVTSHKHAKADQSHRSEDVDAVSPGRAD